MLSASGFTAANAAVRYLSSLAEGKAKLAEANAKAPASVPTSEVKADVSAKATELPSAVPNVTKQLSTPSLPSQVEVTSSELSNNDRPLKRENNFPPKGEVSAPESKQTTNLNLRSHSPPFKQN